MSFERSLKTSLERSADAIDPDVATALEAVTSRHRRGTRVRRATYSVLAVAALVGIVLGTPRALDALRDEGLPPADDKHSNETTLAYHRLAGVYTRRVDERAGIVRTYQLAGRWTMRLSESGAIDMQAPPGFTELYGPPAVGRFELDGRRFVTNALFHSGLGCERDGTYEWSFHNGALTLATIDDGCPYRALVFATEWREIQGSL
jgi:hypothetical protein